MGFWHAHSRYMLRRLNTSLLEVSAEQSVEVEEASLARPSSSGNPPAEEYTPMSKPPPTFPVFRLREGRAKGPPRAAHGRLLALPSPCPASPSAPLEAGPNSPCAGPLCHAPLGSPSVTRAFASARQPLLHIYLLLETCALHACVCYVASIARSPLRSVSVPL